MVQEPDLHKLALIQHNIIILSHVYINKFEYVVIMVERMTDEVRQESPRTTMTADDPLIHREGRKHVEENLQWWGSALDRNKG